MIDNSDAARVGFVEAGSDGLLVRPCHEPLSRGIVGKEPSEKTMSM